MTEADVTPQFFAPQHGPRPLPLFLDMVRSETEAEPARTAAVLAGLAAYQQAPRPAPPPVMPRRGPSTCPAVRGVTDVRGGRAGSA